MSDDGKTNIFDPTTSRSKKPTARGVGDGARPRAASPAVEIATPTQVDRPERSEPIVAISMKTPGTVEKAAPKDRVVQLRALSEVSGQHARPVGNLAPPRDPREVRSRRVRDALIWGSVVVIVGCAVMLAVWFLARR